MMFRSAWRKGSALLLGAALIGGAFLGATGASAQFPPSLIVITGVTSGGAPVTSGAVSAWVGTTKCQEKALSGTTTLEVGQPDQPAACTGAGAGTAIAFQVDGKAATATPAAVIKSGIPQRVTLAVGAAAPAPAKTGNGGYLGSDESGSGLAALAFGAVALAAVGGGLAVRRVRR